MKHTVRSIIKAGLQYDRGWAIYATSCDAGAEARLGQTQFENGGVLDDKHFICNGEQLGDAILRWTDDEDVDELDIDGLLAEEICE